MKLDDTGVYQFFDELANNPLFKLNFYEPDLNEKENPLIFDVSSLFDVNKHYKNLRLLYDDITAKEYIVLINNLQKIIRKFIGINGIERLLTTNYSNIEWSMFLEFDFDKSKPKHTRDHFIHQFRDAYLSLQFLNHCGIYEKVMQVFKEDATIVSKYINFMIKENKEKNKSNEKCYKEIIFKSIILSSIFHDLGYPLSYFSRISQQIQGSLPFYKMVCSTGKTDFENIQALLADSLLFRTVKNKEISDRYNKSDHGTLSAISFLLNFYYTGGIVDLKPIDRCIIELAARSIYDHTNEYAEDQRMTFYENPLSYILRISDDLQEWERFNFIVDNNSNSMICLNTYEPIITDNGKIYETQDKLTRFLKTTSIEYKKLNYIKACTEIELEEINNDSIVVNIVYKRYSLIELSILNPYFAVYRLNELLKVKKMLPNQKNLPNIEIKYNLSNNVFFLANYILQDFLKKKKSFNLENTLNKIQNDKTIENNVQLVIEEQLKKINDKEFLSRTRNLIDYLKDQDTKTKFYCPYHMELFDEHLIEESLICLTTDEYSNYLIKSKDFLKDYSGLIGLLDLLVNNM